MADSNGKVVSLVCERACDLNAHLDDKGRLKDAPGVSVVKFPCSGMIQPLMIEAAFKAGASGVIVTGCQLGDCYYREGNKLIRERLLGDRPPGLKKTVDRRRVVALWLQRMQTGRFISEAKEFVQAVTALGPVAAEPAKAAPAKPAAAVSKAESAKPAAAAPKAESAKPAAAAPKAEAKSESKPSEGDAKAEADREKKKGEQARQEGAEQKAEEGDEAKGALKQEEKQ